MILMPFAVAVATAAALPSSTCTSLNNQWQSVLMDLADSHAEGVADNSAPRATMRAIQDSNTMSKASMLLTIMQSNHCALPTAAPDWFAYSAPAMKCRLDIMKLSGSDLPESCKRASWTPAGK